MSSRRRGAVHAAIATAVRLGNKAAELDARRLLGFLKVEDAIVDVRGKSVPLDDVQIARLHQLVDTLGGGSGD